MQSTTSRPLILTSCIVGTLTLKPLQFINIGRLLLQVVEGAHNGAAPTRTDDSANATPDIHRHCFLSSGRCAKAGEQKHTACTDFVEPK